MSNFEKVLEQEIADSGIDTKELGNFIWGGEKEVEFHRNVLDTVCEDSTIAFRPHFYDMDRGEGFHNNMRRITRINALADQGRIPHVSMENYGTYSIGVNTLYPTSVHHGMFESIVKVLGSDEQIKQHWDDIEAYKILGCYAQTEIGHGSDVQSLQTQAVYDEATEEFVIHTPTLKDAKFWPGDMGKMANHVVLFCKLIIKEESYGIHAFFFRIRDENTHAPLKGIEVGDIGPKYGYPQKDNGYLMFNKFRVPRSAILSRYVNVTKEGMIEIRGDPRVAYATMLWIRVTLLVFSWQIMFGILCKSVRYALKRTQFKSLPGSDQERRILEYQATQAQLIPVLAFGYANVFISQFCMSLYYQMQENIKKDDFKIMNELHVLISCLKAYYMDEGIMNLLAMRECNGAHGYSAFSSIGGWIEAWSPNVTLEGDGFVLYQQTTRKLIKIVSIAQKGKKYNK